MIIAMAALALATAAGTTTTTAPAPPPPTTVVAPTTTGATTTVPSGPTTTIPIPADYTPLIDDTGTIVLAVPNTWVDVNTGAFMPEADAQTSTPGSAAPVAQPSIVASPDIAAFYSSFDVPGVSYFAIPYTDNPLSVVSTYGLTSGCVSIAFKEYDDPIFVGYIQIGTDCGPQHMTWNMVVANPADKSFTAIVQIQTADPSEMETILRTFNEA